MHETHSYRRHPAFLLILLFLHWPFTFLMLPGVEIKSKSDSWFCFENDSIGSNKAGEEGTALLHYPGVNSSARGGRCSSAVLYGHGLDGVTTTVWLEIWKNWTVTAMVIVSFLNDACFTSREKSQSTSGTYRRALPSDQQVEKMWRSSELRLLAHKRTSQVPPSVGAAFPWEPHLPPVGALWSDAGCRWVAASKSQPWCSKLGHLLLLALMKPWGISTSTSRPDPRSRSLDLLNAVPSSAQKRGSARSHAGWDAERLPGG